jgi:hypothetical protein
MPGLVPGIHVLLSCCRKDVDGRDKPGHDEVEGGSMVTELLPRFAAVDDSLEPIFC